MGKVTLVPNVSYLFSARTILIIILFLKFKLEYSGYGYPRVWIL